MMGLFYLLTLYAAVRSLTATRSWRWTVASGVACLLAMGWKEVAVLASLVVLLYDRVYLRHSAERCGAIGRCTRHGVDMAHFGPVLFPLLRRTWRRFVNRHRLADLAPRFLRDITR